MFTGKYIVRATDTGFQLSWGGRSATITLDEKGGHGPIEKLYGVVERMSRMTRPGARDHTIGKADAVGLIMMVDELKSSLETDLDHILSKPDKGSQATEKAK